LGILIGDGELPHPGLEQIIETFYQFPIGTWKVMFDYQFVVNPAYNRDRGPVSLYLRTSEKNSDLLHKCYSFDSDTYSLSGHRADLRMVARAGVAAKFTFLVHSHRSKSTTLIRG
jgi:hypothetical protein